VITTNKAIDVVGFGVVDVSLIYNKHKFFEFLAVLFK